MPALLIALLAAIAGLTGTTVGASGAVRAGSGGTGPQPVTVSAAQIPPGAGSAPTDSVRLTLARPGTPAPGVGLAARAYQPGRPGRGFLAERTAGHPVPVVFFSLFRSRAPPAAAW
jgi:hypothetical protein